MKILVSCVLILTATCIPAITLPGCAATGTSEGDNAVHYLQAETLYTSTLRTMTALANSGKVTREQAEEFEGYRASASRLLDEWRESVMAHEPFNGWDSLESILEELLRVQAEAAASR